MQIKSFISGKIAYRQKQTGTRKHTHKHKGTLLQ